MIFVLLSFFCILFGMMLYVIVEVRFKNNEMKLEKNIQKNPKIAILIPARNESKVIEELLLSIEKQTVSIPSENIYVIVESDSDPTLNIAKKHHISYFIRQKLHLKSKGYALQELIEDLHQKQKFYDLYFIFDADNVLEPNFIEMMLEDYYKGYAVSTGYRALKNKDHYFPISAGLTFSFINDIRNRNALKHQANLLLSGTGYYIHGDYIKKWGTFPFHSLTEDYESSLYYALENISTHYQEKAVFYDEQPESYKKSIVQRSRWIKGYFTNYIKYQKLFREKLKENPTNAGSILEMQMGVFPAILILLGLFFLIIANCTNLYRFLILIVLIYVILFLITMYLLKLSSKKRKLNKKLYFQVLFYHPIFMVSYIHALLRAIWKRDLPWEEIKHGEK